MANICFPLETLKFWYTLDRVWLCSQLLKNSPEQKHHALYYSILTVSENSFSTEEGICLECPSTDTREQKKSMYEFSKLCLCLFPWLILPSTLAVTSLRSVNHYILTQKQFTQYSLGNLQLSIFSNYLPHLSLHAVALITLCCTFPDANMLK